MSSARWVLHVDLDQFIAAVEVLRQPELRGRPVVVGGTGDPTQRAVVATASYEAREFGIHSGMPLRTAAKRCPDAVFLPSDPAAYEEVSAKVMATLREFGRRPEGGAEQSSTVGRRPEGGAEQSSTVGRRPEGGAEQSSTVDAVVEVMGWDEAFLGVQTSDPEALARDIQRAVTTNTQLSCSIGIGDNKLRAKLATGFAKPAGVFRLTRHNWFAVMADRPTDALWGIGRKTARKLAELGLSTVAQLAAADPTDLAQQLGPTMGPWYVQVARGAGTATVSATPWVARGRSRETTFQQNLTDWSAVRREVAALARRVTEDVIAEGRPAVRVGVKVRFAPFFTQTRSLTLPAPTSDGATIEQAALTALDRFEEHRPVRLLGVRAEFDKR